MKIMKLVALALFAAASVQTQAAFVATDWKVSGDKLATLDTQTGLEWLDLTRTDNMSISQVRGLLDTTFLGWRFPTAAEIDTMMRNFVGTVVNFDSVSNGLVQFNSNHATQNPNVVAVRQEFLALFGLTHSYSASINFQHLSTGLYLDEFGSVRQAGVHYTGYDTGRTNVFFNNYLATHVTTETGKHGYHGIWLVSDGGTTLSSVNDPTLNINNPNAPINAGIISPPANDVSAPLFGFLGLFSLGIFSMRNYRSRKH